MKIAAAILCCLCVSAGLAAQHAPQLVERVWYDGDRPEHVWMAPDQVAVIFSAEAVPRTRDAAEAVARRAEPGATLVRQHGPVAWFRISDPSSRREHVARLRQQAGVRHASAAFYETPDARPETATALTGEIIVTFRDGQQAGELARRHGIRLLSRVGSLPNTYVFDARDAEDILTLANSLRGEPGVALSSPAWTRNVVAR